MRKKYQYLALLLCVGSALAISAFTFQNSSHSAQLTLKFVNVFEKVHFHLTGTVTPEYPVYHMMRKFAHTAEYFALGASACYLFSSLGRKRYVLDAVLLSAGWSLIDQTSKLLVPGREFDPTDFPFDITGYLLGIALVFLLKYFFTEFKTSKAVVKNK